MKYRLQTFNIGTRIITRTIPVISVGRRSVASALAMLMLATVSLGFTSGAVKKGEFQGNVELQFCSKSGDGRWEVVDTLKVSNVRFSATLDEITGGKQLAEDFTFQGKTGGGRQVSVRMQGPGKGVPNLTGGRAGLSMPLKITVNGKTADVKLDMTTESVTAADGGTIRGRRLEIDQATGTVKFALVGSQSLNGLLAIFAPSGDQAGNAMFFPGQLRVAIQLDGKLTALNDQ